jgi:hypothetical protein
MKDPTKNKSNITEKKQNQKKSKKSTAGKLLYDLYHICDITLTKQKSNKSK